MAFGLARGGVAVAGDFRAVAFLRPDPRVAGVLLLVACMVRADAGRPRGFAAAPGWPPEAAPPLRPLSFADMADPLLPERERVSGSPVRGQGLTQ